MRWFLLGMSILVCTAYPSFAQDFDSDFRLCNGMPASQVAFAMALGGGDLQNAALAALKANPASAGNVQALYKNLFEPSPNSLIQLNSRVDQYLNPISLDLANQLRMQFNQVVALRVSGAKSGDNIVCSMSLLSYRETSDVFGKRIANQYGVVQVTIRNTDSNHEFLLHQVDFWFGDTLQYYATRDRKIARGVAEKGQVVDPRNFTIRVLEGIGEVAGATTAIYSSSAQLASSIYSSNFVPAVRSIFPDLTVQQMAKLDDMGFSAGASTMVIPKNGAISFVAFIPSDSFLLPKLSQYEQQLTKPDNTTKQLLDKCNDFYLKIGAQKNDLSLADTQAMQAKCDSLQARGPQPLVGALSSTSVQAATGQSKSRSAKTLWLHSAHKNLSDYDPAVVLLLQRDLQVLVAGSHIQAITNQLALSSVSCGAMPSPLVSGSVVSCALSGTHLDLVTQARLINKLDSTQSVSSNGLQTAKDDTSHAQVTFPACSFTGTADYLLEITATTGAIQNSTPQNLNAQPVTLSCIKNADGSATCQVNGLTTVTATSATLTGTGSSPQTANLAFGANNSANIATPLPKTDTYSVSLKTSDGKTAQLCSPIKF